MLDKVKDWWKNNHTMTIRCNSEQSSVILSKKLFESVQSDHPSDTSFNVMFAKINSNDSRVYVMFFNPEWEKHGVNDPHKIQTVPVTLGKLGHVGFQSVQPSVKELQVMYGRESDTFELKVSKAYINDEPYYILEK